MESSIQPQSPPESPEAKLDYWREQIELWKISGLTQPKFCEEYNLNYTTFVYWRSKLYEQERPKQSKKLVSVKIPTHPKAQPTHCLRMRLQSGVVLEIPAVLSSEQFKIIFDSLGVST